jgi:hypothetical protein
MDSWMEAVPFGDGVDREGSITILETYPFLNLYMPTSTSNVISVGRIPFLMLVPLLMSLSLVIQRQCFIGSLLLLVPTAGCFALHGIH